MITTRTQVARTLRSAGFTASKSVGRGSTSGFHSWDFAGTLYLTYEIGTGNRTANDGPMITDINSAMADALNAAGYSCTILSDRIEIKESTND